MKIASLETFTDQFVCFVRLTTDSGSVVWGQTSTYNADITATIFHRQVAPWALGAGAFGIAPLIERIEEREHKFPGSYRCRALAGLDTALWDLRGKLEGKPVVELLGGQPRRLRAYASSMRRDIQPADEARRLVRLRDELGFDAFEWRVPLTGMISAPVIEPEPTQTEEETKAEQADIPQGQSEPASPPSAHEERSGSASTALVPPVRRQARRNASKSVPVIPLVHAPDDPGPEDLEESEPAPAPQNGGWRKILE